jgi:hypothetical protein
MKKHWRQSGSAILIRQMEEILAQPVTVPEAENEAAELAWSRGYDVDPPRTPAMDRIAELRAVGDYRTLNREHALRGLHIDAEKEARNLTRWNAMRRWASDPSNEERQAEELKRARQEAEMAAIEARALAIVAEQNKQLLERARKQARAEAKQNHE